MKALINYYENLNSSIIEKLPNIFSVIFGSKSSIKYSKDYFNNKKNIYEAGNDLNEWISENCPSVLESYI